MLSSPVVNLGSIQWTDKSHRSLDKFLILGFWGLSPGEYIGIEHLEQLLPRLSFGRLLLNNIFSAWLQKVFLQDLSGA